MYRRALLSSWLFLLLLLSVAGQQPSPSPQQPLTPPAKEEDVVRITTSLVLVDVVVTKDGKQVTDLKPEDFELFEDGKPQTITHFAYISNIPSVPSMPIRQPPNIENVPPVAPDTVRPNEVRRTVAFLVDDLGMSQDSMSRVASQLRKYIDEQLQPNDLVAIIRTGGDVGSLQMFTTDKRVLHSAIDHLKWNPCSRTGLYVFSPKSDRKEIDSAICGNVGGVVSITNTLSSFRFVLEGMRSLPGRKSMVVFSDNLPIQQQVPEQASNSSNQPGGDPMSVTPDSRPSTQSSDAAKFDDVASYGDVLQRVAEVAIRSAVVIYAIDTRGLQFAGVTAADRVTGGEFQQITSDRWHAMLTGREGADLIARQTGGFLIRNSNDFGIQRVMDDQRGYYLLGYRPGDQTFDRHFHHISARVTQRGLTLRTREGFYGVTEDEMRRTRRPASDQMSAALTSPFGAGDITMRLTAFFANDAATGDLMRTFLHIDPGGLTFIEEPDGKHKVTLDFSGIVFGDNGIAVARKDLSGELHLKPQAYEQAKREGIVYGFDMPLKQSGIFRVRVAVRDKASSRIGAAGQFVEVPNLRSGRLVLSGIVVRNEAARLSPAPSQSAQPEERSAASGPAVRQFSQGSTLQFLYQVYNATVDNATHQPRLSAQVRIFRDGNVVFSSNEAPLEVTGQTDPRRISGVSRFQLGTKFPPGGYMVQIIVRDQLAREEKRATQSIDCEVIN